MTPGTVIFINGPSCSGKTTLARKLQEVLPDLFLLAQLDNFIDMLPVSERKSRENVLKNIRSFIYAFHDFVKSASDGGTNVIVDHVIEEREWLDHLSALLTETRILTVGLLAEKSVLEERAKARGNRSTALVDWHLNRVNWNIDYDLMFDTGAADVEEISRDIVRYLDTENLRLGLHQNSTRRVSYNDP